MPFMPFTEQQRQQVKDAAYKAAVKEAQQQGWLATKDSGTDKICHMIAAALLAAVDAYDGMIYGDDDGGY